MERIRSLLRPAGVFALALIIAAGPMSLSGCGVQRGTADEERPAADKGRPIGQHADPMTVLEKGRAGIAGNTRRAVVPLVKIDGRTYCDAEKLAGLIGFHTEYSEDGKSLLIGDHDVILTITDQSRMVVQEERNLTMVRPAILVDGRMHVPSSELKRLFGEEAAFTVDAVQAVVFPENPANDNPGGVEGFADDPDDPAGAPWTAHGSDTDDADTAAADLINEAKRYLGVKYQFGAEHYSKSKRFDCSSFVQYLFAGQGIKLPRTARAQAELGKEVPRDKLRRGDLLFFHVPGRFKDDTTVGHVGIYIGDRKMIHSSPLPQDGVQITDIDKTYWKQTFLFAKRLL